MSSQKTIRVAILDDYFNIAPQKFQRLSPAMEVTSFPHTLNTRLEDERAQFIKQLQPFSVLSTMRERTRLPADVLKALPNLKLIATTGLANAAIDLTACRELGITVCGATGAGSVNAASKAKINGLEATNEHTWALILALSRNIAQDDATVRQGGWQTGPAIGLKGKNLALLGLGKLGMMAAKVGKLAFGMNITAWSMSLTQEQADEKAQAAGLAKGDIRVIKSKEELIKEADILSIHYVLSERSQNIVDAKELAIMKPHALLINTSRGPLVNEKALLKCLQEGKIGGAALDVYDVEPLPADSPWRTTAWGENGISKVLLSPHMGYVEEDVMDRWYDETVENIERWLKGEELKYKMT